MFPHSDKEDFAPKLTAVQYEFVEFIKRISFSETCVVIVKNEKQKSLVYHLLLDACAKMDNIKYLEYAAYRVWMRDSGPIPVINESTKKPVYLDFNFNAWANYKAYSEDDKVPQAVAKFMEREVLQPLHNGKRVTLEGGAIDVNGTGTLLCTEECLLDSNVQVRNPEYTKKDYEEVFKQYFGVSNVIWLGCGIAGDDTHGHVDDFCRFVNRKTVVICNEGNKNDVNYFAMQDNLSRLKSAKLEDGSPLNIVEIPLPEAVYYKGNRLPASYANFLITEKSVLVPIYQDVNDAKALTILKECFPGRDVIGVSVSNIIWGRGSLHCLSHELL
jgi:agmatine deiminase